jgi:hypothetical protein
MSQGMKAQEIRKGDIMVQRWDNAPHWPNMKTFPHHLHLGSKMNAFECRGRAATSVQQHEAAVPTRTGASGRPGPVAESDLIYFQSSTLQSIKPKTFIN